MSLLVQGESDLRPADHFWIAISRSIPTAVVNASYDALRLGDAAPADVLRPYISDPQSPDGGTWLAEGEVFWTQGAVPTANYITGPTYLLNWGIPTIDKLDLPRMRREAIAFTQMLLALFRVPKADLRRLSIKKL